MNTSTTMPLPPATGKDHTLPVVISAPLIPPTLDEIDEALADYDSANRMLKAAQELADTHKQRVIHMVQTFGSMPEAATASKRLAGRHNEAIVTTGTTKSVNAGAVENFREFLTSKGIPTTFDRFFKVETKYVLIDGARDVVPTLSLGVRIEEKLYQLFGLTIEVKTKSPSLKVDVITPEKPARTPRARKQAA